MPSFIWIGLLQVGTASNLEEFLCYDILPPHLVPACITHRRATYLHHWGVIVTLPSLVYIYSHWFTIFGHSAASNSCFIEVESIVLFIIVEGPCVASGDEAETIISVTI